MKLLQTAALSAGPTRSTRLIFPVYVKEMSRTPCVRAIKRNVSVLFRIFFFPSHRFVKWRVYARANAATRFLRYPVSVSIYRRTVPSLFAEHQHHLLFARSIYSVNYICLCSRYTAVVLSSVNCAFTFFPLYLYLFFRLLLFLFVRSSPGSLISLAIWYSARFAISHDIASRGGSPPADWLCQTFAGPHEAGSKFSIRTTFLGVSADLPVCGREITRSPHTRRAAPRRFSFQFYFAALFRTRENFTLHRLFNPFACRTNFRNPRSSAVNSLLFAGTLSRFPVVSLK